MEIEKEAKQTELNDIRNVLDEKLRENSSLKKEKMFFIEKITELERQRQEQQSFARLPTPEREKSPPVVKTIDQNVSLSISRVTIHLLKYFLLFRLTKLSSKNNIKNFVLNMINYLKYQLVSMKNPYPITMSTFVS